MKLEPSDPDVKTLVSRIRDKELDLQPEFQRGEVWGDPKKRRLIDSILRKWHVPPIHVIERDDGRQEVLDGQQRLVAIRDFVDGQLKVDGNIEPVSDEILELDGLTYAELPDDVARKFDRFTIRVYRLTDFEPSEPGELFFRLNQPTSLTAAEQRNAFFGPARQQVKDLVSSLEELGLGKSVLGFSNSRMAYDDVIARVCLTLERQTLEEKITAGQLTNRYRSEEPFSEEVYERSERAIARFGSASSTAGTDLRFNKATLYSWLCAFGVEGWRSALAYSRENRRPACVL